MDDDMFYTKTDVLKKRKEATFLADTLDHTAPVEKIIEVLQTTLRKNKVAGLYSQTVRQRRTIANFKNRKTRHFLIAGHPLNAFSEDWDGGLNSGYFEEFPHRCLLPKMITPVRNSGTTDPVTDLMYKKVAWDNAMLDFKQLMNKTRNKKRPLKWISDDLLYCQKRWVEIATFYEQNPDRYFQSNYNWYYAGHGNMKQITFAGTNYLLQSEFTCLRILEFTSYSLTIHNDSVVTYDCEEDILETVSSLNIVALRTKYKIFILKLIESDSSLQIEKIKEFKSDLPFTGISFDEYHMNILYVTALDYKLTIVNIDRMVGRTKQLKGQVVTLVDNWSTVIGSERGYFTHVTKNGLTLYDKRTNAAFQRWKSLRKVVDDNCCNDVSVARHCKGKPQLYFGTDHHLFLMDMRYNKTTENNLKAVQRWTHGMQCLPTFMSINSFDYNKELICMSSQWCEDLFVFSNHAERPARDFDVRSVSLPYQPPSIFQTLNEAKEKMLCCDLHNPIDSRLSAAVTGLSVVEEDDNYHILMLNSMGDISAHTLFPRHMTSFFEDDGIQLLHEWSKGYKREVKDLGVTNILDISEVWKQLKVIPDSIPLGVNRLAKKVHNFNEDEIHEAIKNEEIESGLLDIWMKDSTEKAEETKDESTLNQFFCD